MNSKRKLMRNQLRKEVGNKNLKVAWSRLQINVAETEVKEIKRELKKAKGDVTSYLTKKLYYAQQHYKFLVRRSYSRGY